jgi:hypothetical protein
MRGWTWAPRRPVGAAIRILPVVPIAKPESSTTGRLSAPHFAEETARDVWADMRYGRDNHRPSPHRNAGQWNAACRHAQLA